MGGPRVTARRTNPRGTPPTTTENHDGEASFSRRLTTKNHCFRPPLVENNVPRQLWRERMTTRSPPCAPRMTCQTRPADLDLDPSTTSDHQHRDARRGALSPTGRHRSLAAAPPKLSACARSTTTDDSRASGGAPLATGRRAPASAPGAARGCTRQRAGASMVRGRAPNGVGGRGSAGSRAPDPRLQPAPGRPAPDPPRGGRRGRCRRPPPCSGERSRA
jgi:hypothetical protein